MKLFQSIKCGPLFLLLVLSASTCADYRFSINEREIYSPDAVFTDYSIADSGLRGCVERTLADQHISNASQLEELNCSNAGIADLQGIERFTGLLRLKLSANRIADLTPLLHLQMLVELQVDDNALTSLQGLHGLTELRHLDLDGNPGLSCGELTGLDQRGNLRLEVPEHC